MKWIDIKEDQPEQDFEVIVCSDDDVFLSVFRKDSDGYWFDCEEEKNRIVTHWMEKPEPFGE